VLSDLLTNDFPAWTLSVNFSQPIGKSPQQANLARVRLQQTKDEAQLKNQELQVATQVRQAARQVVTNQQRVQTTRASREFAERRLEPSSASSPRAPRPTSSSSRRSATCRWPGTTSCAQSSITFNRRWISRPCRKFRCGKRRNAEFRMQHAGGLLSEF
jgi:hypothetical protein